MDKLKTIIAKGLIIDSYKSEQAMHVYNLIAANASLLNSREEKIAKSFGYMQQLSKIECIISLARIFDSKSARNNIRCFESAIDLLMKNNDLLIPSHEIQVFEHLDYYHIPKEIIELLNQNRHGCFTLKLALYFQQKLENNSQKINKIKTWRDKIIAHNEDYHKVVNVQIIELNDLFELIWEFVTIIGWVYLDTVYGKLGDYTIRNQSKFRQFDLKKLIENI